MPRRHRDHVQEVRVVTQLDEDLDLWSFRLGDIHVGKINVHIPEGRALFQGEFDFSRHRRLHSCVSAPASTSSRARRRGCCRPSIR